MGTSRIRGSLDPRGVKFWILGRPLSQLPASKQDHLLLELGSMTVWRDTHIHVLVLSHWSRVWCIRVVDVLDTVWGLCGLGEQLQVPGSE